MEGIGSPAPRPAALFDKTPSNIQRPAPGLGEHNTELLTELGYSPEQIQGLSDEGVIVGMPDPS